MANPAPWSRRNSSASRAASSCSTTIDPNLLGERRLDGVPEVVRHAEQLADGSHDRKKRLRLRRPALARRVPPRLKQGLRPGA